MATGTEYSQEDLSLATFASDCIPDGGCLSGIIDKDFLAGFVMFTKNNVGRISPLLVVVTKLSVLKACGVRLLIFMPQEHFGD